MYGRALEAPNRWGAFRRAIGIYLTLILATGAVTTPTTLLAIDYYVETTGSDGNNGLSTATAFRTITNAVSIATAGDVIHVGTGTFDSAGGEAFPIDIVNGVNLMGAGAGTTIVEGDSGDPVFFGDTDLDPNTIIQGFTITHDSNDPNNVGIQFDLDDVTMSPQILDNAFLGFGLDPNNPQGVGILMRQTDADGSDEVFTPTISGNTFTDLNKGFYGDNSSPAGGLGDTVSPTIANNTFTNNDRGIDFYWSSGTPEGTIAPMITGNTFSGNLNDVISFDIDGTTSNDIEDLTFTPTISNNTIVGGGSDGVVISITSLSLSTDATLIVSPTITGNSIEGLTGSSEAFELSMSSIYGDGLLESNLTISGNRINDVSGSQEAIDISMDEIYVEFDSRMTIRGNTISNLPDADGITIDVSSMSTITNLDWLIENNMITDVGGDGISMDLSETMEFTSSASMSIIVRGNTIDGADDGDGVEISITTLTPNSIPVTILVEGNSISNVGDAGIELSLTDWSDVDPNNVTVTVRDNFITGAASDGVDYAVEDNDAFPGALFTCNTITGNQTGVYLSNSLSSSGIPDFGGGATGSPGYNTIMGNTTFDFFNEFDGTTISAQSNWWGTTSSSAIDANISDDNEGSGSEVDFSNFLLAAPTGGVTFTLDDVLTEMRIDYEAVVTGFGDCGCAGATFTIPIPAGTTLVPGSVTTDTGDILSLPDPNDPNSTITVQIGYLPTGNTATINFSVDVDPGATEVTAQGTVTKNGGSPTLSDDPNALGGGPTITLFALSQVPTLEWWAMMFMTTMLLGAGVLLLRRRSRGGIALLLAFALSLPAIDMLAATTKRSVTKPAAKVTATHLVKASSTTTTGRPLVTLQLADGSTIQAPRSEIEIKDHRGKGARNTATSKAERRKNRDDVKVDALWNGMLPQSQTMIVKVRYDKDGSVKKVKIDLYPTLDDARAKLDKKEHNRQEREARRAAKGE